ncbi:MAG: prepilin-type cleavage/methylation domain-containing protein [Acidovorax sp.]|uniref:type II secretion system protein n=1 Tax=Acidovorax sp. TaxID=1872122 RepID=UPI00261DD38A|nr:prepilin-type cleavage/methylation domain-containing protein [Acidovorax sp.]MDH4415787.1 prepilin-type cleavage/methylation domain-containing protein [Acidovorax sp.]
MKRSMQGFTLVEISVILLALGLILPGAIVLWQLSERQRVTTVQVDVQQQTRDALVGYLHSNYRLPCPAADTAGVESCTDGGDLRHVGFVPWRTLGLPRPEAGALRYGVYREPSATAHGDRDLASAVDRMNPLRVRTPSPKPQNKDAPNDKASPIPSVSTVQLGMTQSGNDAAPLNTACNASDSPPCPLGVARAVNLVDVCLALNTANDNLVAPTGRLAAKMLGTRRSVAFVLVAPGMLDADGDGKAFDGANASATSADPTFEAPGMAATSAYDDSVVAPSHAELFGELHCGAALSAISHAHFNAATGAFVMERALYDYRDQLFVAVKLAEANVAAAAAGFAGAAAGVLAGIKEGVSAAADTTMSAGARSAQIGFAAAAIVAAGLSVQASLAAVGLAGEALKEAIETHSDFATRTTAMTELAISINNNTLKADAIGY